METAVFRVRVDDHETVAVVNDSGSAHTSSLCERATVGCHCRFASRSLSMIQSAGRHCRSAVRTCGDAKWARSRSHSGAGRNRDPVGAARLSRMSPPGGSQPGHPRHSDMRTLGRRERSSMEFLSRVHQAVPPPIGRDENRVRRARRWCGARSGGTRRTVEG